MKCAKSNGHGALAKLMSNAISYCLAKRILSHSTNVQEPRLHELHSNGLSYPVLTKPCLAAVSESLVVS